MNKRKLTIRLMLCFFAAALLTAFVAVRSPQVSAQATAATVVSDSDALMAALADQQCTSIALEQSAVYTITEPVQPGRTLSITGNGAIIDLAPEAAITVDPSTKLSLTDVNLISRQDHSVVVSGSLELGERVVFSGENGILLRSGSQITSGGAAVTAGSELKALITVDAGGGTVVLHDIRLAQNSGSTTILHLKNSSGKISLKGTVDLLAADGAAIFCAPDAAGPEICVEDGSTAAIAASTALVAEGSDIPGAAVFARSCNFTAGTGSRIGITGSYCGIAAKNITLGKDCVITAQCDQKTNTDSLACAAVSAGEKLVCMSGAKITIGSSGSNRATGLYGGQVDIESGVTVIFRSQETGAAIASSGAVSVGANSSINTFGGTYGIRCAGLTTHEKTTLNIDSVIRDGIHSSSRVVLGSNCTVDISARRCAIYAKGAVNMSPGGRINLTSSGSGAALWLDSASGENITVNGCTLTVNNASAADAEKKAAVFSGGGIIVENGADVTAINNGDFAVIAAGGSVSISGGSVMRCSASVGVLLSKGSLLVSDKGSLLAEGLVDSAVRVEKGSFSASSGASVDVQGTRFGVEVASGDFYIDGAASFDIRSTKDRAVFVENGRMTILNIDRLSAWDRHDEKKNDLLWWKNPVEVGHSWEAPGTDKTNWLYARHTALSPNLSQQFSGGNPQPTEFRWFDREWSAADYSRLGQFVSKPVGRANSFNIPSGKSFSWMLFGQSYDDSIVFKLKSSNGDGSFELLENGAFTYTAFDYTRGNQSFDFVVTNSDGVESDPVTVNIFVTASKPPIASSSTFPVSSSDAHIDQVSVLDYDGNIASIKVVEQPLHGSLVMNSDGRFSYHPEEEFIGIDGFSYYAVDNMGDESSIARVTLPVRMTDQPVVCNTTIITESGVPSSIRLTALLGEDIVTPPPQFTIISPPVYGTVEFSQTEPDLITYVPYPDFSGTDFFTFAALNADGSLTAEGYASIATIPSQRPTANGGVFYCTKNSTCSGRLTGHDVDGRIEFFTLVEQPEHGTIQLDIVSGEFVFSAAGGFTGSTKFTFTVTDSDGLASEPVEVEILVSSLIDNLRETGQLGVAVILLCTVLVGLGALAALLIFSAARRRREEEQQKAKSHLFDFGGSARSNYDYYNDYDDYNN